MSRFDDVSDHFVPVDVDGQHMHVGARGHNLRNVGIAQLDNALNHLPRIFFEQALSVALGHDRTDFFFDRLFVDRLRRSPGDAMKNGVEHTRAPNEWSCQRS